MSCWVIVCQVVAVCGGLGVFTILYRDIKKEGTK